MNIIKYKISKNKYLEKYNYQEWDVKNIILTLIFYICNNINILIYKKIKISKYTDYLKFLFNNLNFVNKNADFFICIKSKKLGDLNIGYIDNFKKIRAKSIYILPYFDSSNALIMYELNVKKKQDIDEIKYKINNFCKTGRKDWDLDIEIKILNKYFKLYRTFNDYNYLRTYINYISGEKIINVPTYIPIQVPYNIQDNNIQDNNNNNNNNNNNENIDQILDVLYAMINNYNQILDKPIHDNIMIGGYNDEYKLYNKLFLVKNLLEI